MKKIDAKSIDLILCDLPFGSSACAWDKQIPIGLLWTAYKRLLKPNGSVLLHGTQPFGSLLVVSNLEWFRTEWIWQKTRPSGFVHCKDSPLKEHESIYVFSPGNWTYNPQMVATKRVVEKERTVKSHDAVCKKARTRKFDNQGLAYPRSIQKFANPNHNNIHPTEKPLDLLLYLINTYSNENDLVLDSCMGSGSTIVACINTNRRAIGIEKDGAYFEAARKRIEQSRTESEIGS